MGQRPLKILKPYRTKQGAFDPAQHVNVSNCSDHLVRENTVTLSVMSVSVIPPPGAAGAGGGGGADRSQ